MLYDSLPWLFVVVCLFIVQFVIVFFCCTYIEYMRNKAYTLLLPVAVAAVFILNLFSQHSVTFECFETIIIIIMMLKICINNIKKTAVDIIL